MVVDTKLIYSATLLTEIDHPSAIEIEPQLQASHSSKRPIVISNQVGTTAGAHSGSIDGRLHALLEVTRLFFTLLNNQHQ